MKESFEVLLKFLQGNRNFETLNNIRIVTIYIFIK